MRKNIGMTINKNNISKFMDATKTGLREKFRVINAYIKKDLKSITFHLKLEKVELNPKQTELSM